MLKINNPSDDEIEDVANNVYNSMLYTNIYIYF